MKNKRAKNVAPSRSKDTFKRKIAQNRKNECSDSDGEINSNDFFHDEIDDFLTNREKILLSGDEEHKEDDSADEEVLPITDDEDSDLEDEEVEEENEDVEKEHYTDSEADFESDYDSKDDDDLPTLDAWGKKKSLYYNADFVDKDRGKSYREEDAEKAKAEESGALFVQNTILNQVCEGFYDLGVPIDGGGISDEEELEAAGKNWQVATKKDKLMLLNRDSPELFVLVKDFKEKMTELLDRLQPLLPLVKDGRLPRGSGTQYIILRYHLILHYCTNISFYMVLKSKCTEAKYHPVMKRLNSFKLLLNKLDPIGEKLNPEINEVLRKLQAGEEICVKRKSEKTDEVNEQDVIHDIEIEEVATELSQKTDQSHKKRKMDEQFDTEIEKEISSLYMDMKRQRSRNFVEDSDDEEEIVNDKQLETENGNDIVGEKRAVTYDIVKNKGILPYRKKEYRNPRVRNRMKFRKAKIRRKGQIREPRKEIHRYGGELTGIRSNITKSIKIK